jgi:hypothetical protein
MWGVLLLGAGFLAFGLIGFLGAKMYKSMMLDR